MTLDQYISIAHENALAKGFHEGELNVPEKLALIHSEVSEMLEAHRAHGFETYHDCFDKPEGFIYEAADVFIRLCDLLGALGFKDEFEDAVQEKMAFNATRTHKHGKKY